MRRPGTPASDEAGQALPLFALFLLVFIGAVALSIDVGRYVWARTQMQAAVDSAALAAAQSLPSVPDAEAQAQAYWEDNASFIINQGENIQFGVTYNTQEKRLTVAASAEIPTWFARLFGVDHWDVEANGTAESRVLDVIVVLDRSGSMCWENYGPTGGYHGRARLATSVNSSATVLRLTKDNPAQPLDQIMWVGQRFRLGSSSEWMQVLSIDNATNQITVQRGVANPNTGASTSRQSQSAGARVQGETCQQAGRGPYYPWEYVKQGAHAFVNAMNPSYDRIGLANFATRGGMVQGLTGSFSTIHTSITNAPDPTRPNGAPANGDWNDRLTNMAHGIWIAVNELRNTSRANAKRIIVFLSDGTSNPSGSANRYCIGTYTVSCPSLGTDTTTARNEALRMADWANQNEVTIYTISYGVDVDAALMTEIADRTGGTWYHAPDDEALIEAFISIATAVQVRLVE